MGNKNHSIMYNADGYYDPTAGLALRNVEKRMPNGYVQWLGQPIYICTSRPIYSEADVQYLERCCMFVARQGGHPIAPLLFYADIFDLTDASERKQILKWTRKWLKQASEIWVFDGEPPKHVKADIQQFIRKGKTIRFFDDNFDGHFTQTKTIQCEPDNDDYTPKDE